MTTERSFFEGFRLVCQYCGIANAVVILFLHLWCSGIRKDHCWAQWNLGRETTKDRGYSHGEVSSVEPYLPVSASQCLDTWILNLHPPLLQLVPLVWQLHRSSVCLCACAVCLTPSTCLSHLLWTHSVFPSSFLSSHSVAQMMLWHSPPHLPPIVQSSGSADVNCVMPFILSLLITAVPQLSSACVYKIWLFNIFLFSFFLPPQGGLTGWNGCGNPWRWGHFRCLLS